MPDYKVPVNDYLFLFNQVMDMQSKYQHVQGGVEASPDMVEAIFQEAAKFCENELAPSTRLVTRVAPGMMAR